MRRFTSYRNCSNCKNNFHLNGEKEYFGMIFLHTHACIPAHHSLFINGAKTQNYPNFLHIIQQIFYSLVESEQGKVLSLIKAKQNLNGKILPVRTKDFCPYGNKNSQMINNNFNMIVL